MLIDCPYYKEFTTHMPAGMGHYNCWSESGWDDYPCNCRVPGQASPICNPKTNGWKDGVFVSKVSKLKLDEVLKQYEYKKSLDPRNIIKRIDDIEKMLREAGIGKF